MSNAEAWLKSVKTKQLDVAKEYEAEMKWLSSSEAKQRADAAKAYALTEFKKRFPSANISRFQVQVDFDTNRIVFRWRWIMGKPTDRRPQILVARSEGCFGVSSRWEVSCTAIAAYTKQTQASSSG